MTHPLSLYILEKFIITFNLERGGHEKHFSFYGYCLSGF